MPPPEAATKYNKAEHLTLRDRLARLNTHSIAKKTTRLSRLFMHEAGIVAKVGSLHPTASPWLFLGLSIASQDTLPVGWGEQS